MPPVKRSFLLSHTGAGIGETGKVDYWIPLDASMDKSAGWEAPGADEAERTGQPSGIVTRTRSFLV